MLQPKSSNIVIFIFLKYYLFYLYIWEKGKINGSNTFSFESISDIFSYLLYTGLFTLIFVGIFSVPLYFALRIKKVAIFILVMIGLLFAEYLVYITLTSTKYFEDTNGVVNGALSLLFLLAFVFAKKKSKGWNLKACCWGKHSITS